METYPSPWPPLFVLFITISTLLSLKHTSYRFLIFPAFPFVILIALHVLLDTSTASPGPARSNFYPALQTLHMLFTASDLLLLSQHLNPVDRRTGKELPPPKTPLEIFKWVLCLFPLNPRGIHWSHEAPYLHRSHLPRWAFVRFQILRCLMLYLLVDAMSVVCQLNPCLHPLGPGLRAWGWMWAVLNTIVYWTTAYASESLLFAVISTLAVAVGISHPSDWPYTFGRLEDLTGIRAFWGYLLLFSF
jgi:hypothetical protein